MKTDAITMTGVVREVLPSTTFKIELENGHIVLGHLSGKMRQKRIRVILGDQVVLEMSPYDLSKGRVVYRYI